MTTHTNKPRTATSTLSGKMMFRMIVSHVLRCPPQLLHGVKGYRNTMFLCLEGNLASFTRRGKTLVTGQCHEQPCFVSPRDLVQPGLLLLLTAKNMQQSLTHHVKFVNILDVLWPRPCCNCHYAHRRRWSLSLPATAVLRCTTERNKFSLNMHALLTVGDVQLCFSERCHTLTSL